MQKISDIGTKYFTTSDYNKFMCEIIDVKIQEKEFVNGLIDNSVLDKKIETLAKKAELKKVNLIQVIFTVKVILKMVALRII